MQEIDQAFKTVLTRKPNSCLNLIFGSKRKTRLKELKMLKETSFVQEWLAESQQEGRREGERKGLQEGKREGKLSVLEIILTQKFGTLSPRLRSQLQKLDDKRLDRLPLKLQQINSQKDLQAWLRNGVSGR